VDSSIRFDIEILITLTDGESSSAWEEFMAEDIGNEDIVGDVFGFELVAADSGVGAAQLARFPAEVAWPNASLTSLFKASLVPI
jgi:hypothetical protein